MSALDTWKFLAGLGLFLYGINLIEHVLKKLSGRSFKLFLKKYTSSLFKAMLGGALITALLQSSSVVALLVLAFVGAGIITFRNALGVILGSNVGTTLSSWIVATVGFKIDIENYSLPVVAITAIAMFFIQRPKQTYNLIRLFFAIGVLFMGLGYMKSGADHLVANFSLQDYTHHGTLVFILIGFILTTIIQSSSATVAITLTVLNSQAIDMVSAAAIVIGSELGTTMKILLGGMKGTSDKKRVAWGNFIFNLGTTLIAYFLLRPILTVIQEVLQIHDELIALVCFQTSINLLTILFFLPVLKPLSNWLEKRFKQPEHHETSLIGGDIPVVPEIAVDAIEQETEKLILKTQVYLNRVMGLSNGDDRAPRKRFHLSNVIDNVINNVIPLEESYLALKQTEGEMLDFYARVQADDLEKEQYRTIRKYIDAVRHTLHAAKALKDIHHDMKDFSAADNDLYTHHSALQAEWKQFDTQFHHLMTLSDPQLTFEGLMGAMQGVFKTQQQNNTIIIEGLKKKRLKEVETSTLMNVQREVLSAQKSMLRALAHLRLSGEQADMFEFLPEN